MKNHIITIILLLLAVISFTMRFFMVDTMQNYCDIAAFLLSTIAALTEIYLSEKNGRKTEEEIKRLKDDQLSVRFEGTTLYFETGAGKNKMPNSSETI